MCLAELENHLLNISYEPSTVLEARGIFQKGNEREWGMAFGLKELLAKKYDVETSNSSIPGFLTKTAYSKVF